MDSLITLDYGSGGKKTSALINEMILSRLGNPALNALGDGAVLDGAEKLVFSTDSFVVRPLFFPGGDIGKLAVCGTVNDLAMAGGEPKYLSLSLILEEGFPTEDLAKILDSLAHTAADCGVRIVTGDTKVVEKGAADGLFINTAGIGFLRAPGLGPRRLAEGDAVLLSGTSGDHGAAVMVAREEQLFSSSLRSDCAPVHRLAAALYPLGDALRVLRDPTRGGVATTLNEFVEDSFLTIALDEEQIPVSPEVSALCEILGLDPLYCACEGRLLAVVAPERAEEALAILRRFPEGRNAARIGTVTRRLPGHVILNTAFGGSRVLNKLSGAQLPRIC